MKNNSAVSRVLTLSPLAAAIVALPCAAQDTQPEETTAGSPVVVTATRIEQSSFDLPTAISSIGEAQIQETGKPQVNISEQLNTVPGTVVQNRDSYAQEQQIIIRGFGARSQFGTRGVKLLADGIPASTPDGQGGPGPFDLSSAQRIEVLRGPFSALYGNHSGGVVQVFTEDGPERPTVSGTFFGGSWDSWKAGVKFGGTSGDVNYIGSLSTFRTEGYREHSEARKDQFNAKVEWDLDHGGGLSMVVNYLNQPDNQDPLGLTKEQVEEDPGQAVAVATEFDTRRSLDNLQGGLVYELPLGDADTLRFVGYLGERDNNGYLAIPIDTQRQVTQSGGNTVLERNFGGLGARWTHRGQLGAGPLTISTGADYELAEEDRKGYFNEFGERGDLKRDEDNTVDSWGVYVQGEWQTTERLALSAGLRYTEVSFESDDHFVCTVGDALCPTATPVAGNNQNLDDSGEVDYSAWTPVAGVVFRLTPAVNVYANVGRSFETPTFIELAYRTDGSGLNFDLDASTSTHYEIGTKAYLTEQIRLEAAVFHIDTKDEIVVESNSGGRATFQNADTTRTGAELALDARFGRGFAGLLSATWLNAQFDGSFDTCPQPAPVGVPPCRPVDRVMVDDGNTVPGVPGFALYGEVSWSYAPWGLNTAVEVRWQGETYVNDVNSETADEFTVVNVRAGLEQRAGRWRFAEFARVDNVFDEVYIGGVIVNDGNGRYYAPAPSASVTVGATVSYAF